MNLNLRFHCEPNYPDSKHMKVTLIDKDTNDVWNTFVIPARNENEAQAVISAIITQVKQDPALADFLKN